VTSLAAALALLCACHLGHPPGSLAAGSVSVGRVEVAAAEPGLADALRSGLGTALAKRALQGQGSVVELTVLDASTAVVAVAGERRVHRALLVVEGRVLGNSPRSVVLRAERSYELISDDGLDGAQRRADTFATLADELTEDLAAWLQDAPPPAPPSPRTP